MDAIAEQEEIRRKLLRAAALENVGAAKAQVTRLQADLTRLRQLVKRGDLDAATLKAIADQARDVNQCVDAIAAYLPG